MTIKLLNFLNANNSSTDGEINTQDKKATEGQALLERDWRYQEIEDAIFHRNLTNALSQVWGSWSSEVSRISLQQQSEISVLRKKPIYLHESKNTEENINTALSRGGLVIMAHPLLTSSINFGHLTIKAKWQNDQLILMLKSPNPIYQSTKKLKFNNFSDLIEAILSTIDQKNYFSSQEHLVHNPEIVVL